MNGLPLHGYMLTQIIALGLAILVFILLIIFLKNIVKLAINTAVGFFALYATSLLLPDLVINVWSVLIVAFGGIFGYLLVLILHLLGLAF